MPKSTRSFRLDATTIARLDERARVRGETRTSVAERYLNEGLRMDEHPLIVFRDGAAGRRAVLAGTRLDVWQIVDTLEQSDNSVADAAAYLGVSEAQARAAVRYYAAYKDEIDEWRERMRAITEREEEVWRREQALLA